MGLCVVIVDINHHYHSAVLLRQRVLMLVLEILHDTLNCSPISAEHQPEDSLQIVGVLHANIHTTYCFRPRKNKGL